MGCKLSCLPYVSCEVWFAWFMWYMWLECVDFLWFEIRKVMIFSIKRVLWWFLEVFHGFAIEGLSWFSTSFMNCCLKDFHDFECGFTNLEVYKLICFPEEKVLWFFLYLLIWKILWFYCRFWLLGSFMILMLICEFKDFQKFVVDLF